MIAGRFKYMRKGVADRLRTLPCFTGYPDRDFAGHNSLCCFPQLKLIRYSFSRREYTKKDFVCQLNIDNKMCSLVSMFFVGREVCLFVKLQFRTRIPADNLIP